MDGRKEILLIEDDLDLANIITLFFNQRKINVHHYLNPLEARDAIFTHKLKVDAIITDLNLPQFSGLELIKYIKLHGLDIPIILITVSHDVDIAVEAIEAGAYDFVVKPLHFPQLYISVQRAFRHAKLSIDNKVLKHSVELSRGKNPASIIGKSDTFSSVMEMAQKVAHSNATLCVTGESGSGKEVLIQAIHQWSPRRSGPFVAINCSAIPENLLESELFGHAKGAFTGAVDKKIGLFEEAAGGTIFMDEIGDMPLPLQTKLLRVLQERKIKRVGENQLRDIDVRIITATHKDLWREVFEKRFREDLFFRLNVIPIRIPPLRNRQEDIIPLAEFFLMKFNALNNKHVKGFADDCKNAFLANPWKGNVRELENVVERAVILCTKDLIENELILDPCSYQKDNDFKVASDTCAEVGFIEKMPFSDT